MSVTSVLHGPISIHLFYFILFYLFIYLFIYLFCDSESSFYPRRHLHDICGRCASRANQQTPLILSGDNESTLYPRKHLLTNALGGPISTHLFLTSDSESSFYL